MKAKYVIHPVTGAELKGLHWIGSTNRYYTIRDGKRDYSQYKDCKTLADACFRYEMLNKGLSVGKLELSQDIDVTTDTAIDQTMEYLASVYGDSMEIEINPSALVNNKLTVAARVKINLRDYFRDNILNPSKRHKFAIDMGIPELARLDLIGNANSMSLVDMGTNFLADKKATIKHQTYIHCKLYWEDFVEFVTKHSTAKTNIDLTREVIKEYREYIIGKKKSPAYSNHRFSCVRQIFRHCELEYGIDNPSFIALLKKGKTKAKDPRGITRENYHTLYAAADDELKLAMLMMLNGAFLPIDLERLHFSDIDFKTKDIIGLREKVLKTLKETPEQNRACILWDRTIKALQEWKEKQGKKDTDLIFNSNKNVMTKRYNRVRVDCHLFNDKYTQFYRMRKSATSIASTVSELASDILSGHSTGIVKDSYIVGERKHVEKACKEIEKRFFS